MLQQTGDPERWCTFVHVWKLDMRLYFSIEKFFAFAGDWIRTHTVHTHMMQRSKSWLALNSWYHRHSILASTANFHCTSRGIDLHRKNVQLIWKRAPGTNTTILFGTGTFVIRETRSCLGAFVTDCWCSCLVLGVARVLLTLYSTLAPMDSVCTPRDWQTHDIILYPYSLIQGKNVRRIVDWKACFFGRLWPSLACRKPPLFSKPLWVIGFISFEKGGGGSQ